MKQEKNKTKKDTLHLISLLSHLLSDTAVLFVKTLNFHWNMHGPQFYMYHRLLEDQYKELLEAQDEIAERIRMLGGIAPGSMEEFLKHACLKESKSTLSQDQMIKELVSSHEALADHCHQIIEFSDSIKDPGTSDLVIERVRFHDKQTWLLRSHFRK